MSILRVASTIDITTTHGGRARGAGLSIACLLGLACGPAASEADDRQRLALLELELEGSGTTGDEASSDEASSSSTSSSTTGDDPSSGDGWTSYGSTSGGWTGYDPSSGGSWTGYDPTTGGSWTGYDPSSGGSWTGYDPSSGDGSTSGYDPTTGGSWTGYDPSTSGGSWTGYDPSTSGGSWTGYDPSTSGGSWTGYDPSTSGDGSTTGDSGDSGDSGTEETGDDECVETTRTLPEVPAACHETTTIEELMACKTAMNVDLTTFLAALIQASELNAGSQATCSDGSAQPATCWQETAPDDLRVFIDWGNLTLSITLAGNRIEVGQNAIPGYPAAYMTMADIHFGGDDDTTSVAQAYYDAYNNSCDICHTLGQNDDDTPFDTIKYTPPGENQVDVKITVLPPIGITADDHGSEGPPNARNTTANLRNPTTLFESACIGSYRSSDFCNRLGAVLGHTPVDCAAPVECDGDDECDPGEHNADCPDDCPKICGNSLCEDHETAQSCAYDCAS
jgi:hypothetical protein